MTAPEGPSLVMRGRVASLRGAALILADVVHGRELVGSNPSHCSFAGYQEVVFDVGDLSGSTGIGVNLVLDGVSTHLDVGGQHLGGHRSPCRSDPD